MIHILSLSVFPLDADTRQPQDLPQMHQDVTQMASQDQDDPLLVVLTVCQPVSPTHADVALSIPLAETEAAGENDTLDLSLSVSSQSLGRTANHKTV